MKRFIAPTISFSALMLAAIGAAALIVRLSVRTGSLKPVAEVSGGQIIYSVNIATQIPQTVVTGYRVAAIMPPPVKFSHLTGGTDGADTARHNEKTAPRRRKKTLSGDGVAVEPKNRRPAYGRAAEGNTADELLNPYIIEKLVKSSDKTYYFTEKSLTRSGVAVELLSVTPRPDDYFLKFRIANAGKEHFIPQAFAVKHGDEWVDVEKFFPKYLVEGGQSHIGYLRVKTPYGAGAKERVFQLNESGGGFRKYSIFF